MADVINIDAIVRAHPLISDQVSTEQVSTILRELDHVLAHGPDGDIVEFGCYIGTTSLFIRRLLDTRRENRSFHVYDSFAGLPPKTIEDASIAGDQFKAGELSVSKKQLLREFKKAGLAAPVIHKAWFNELSDRDVPAKIAFAFLDGDFYGSIMDSLKLVWPRLQPDGCLIIDDYAREALPGAARAVQAFLPKEYSSRIKTVHNLGILQR